MREEECTQAGRFPGLCLALPMFERFLTNLFRCSNSNDFVENLRLCRKACRAAFRDRSPGKLATVVVVCRSHLLLVSPTRLSRNSLNGIACMRVKNLDILWQRLSFSLSVAAKSHYRERRLLFSSLDCD